MAISAIVTSCKKDNIDSKALDATAEFYLNESNNEDGLLAEVKLNKENAVVFFYGSADTEGTPYDINSVSYVSNISDTITNVILDSDMRASIITFKKKNGTMLNTIVKFDYIENDTIIFNIYQYNWLTQRDSLLYQTKVKDSSLFNTHSSRIAFDFNIEDFKKEAIKFATAVAIAAFACGVVAVSVALIPPALAFAVANPHLAIAGIIFAAGAIASASPNQTLNPNHNSNAPTSPTATNATIPNPIGTPENPDGEMGTVTIYGAHSCHYLDTACFNDDASSLSVRTYTVNIYKHINGELELVKSSIIIKSHFWDNFNSNECNGINGITLSFPQGEYSWIASRGEYSLGGGFSIKDGLCTTTVIWF